MSENNYPVKVNEAELKAKLDPLSYDVLRNAATERPFTGEYTDTDKVGVYKCKACAAELFRSEHAPFRHGQLRQCRLVRNLDLGECHPCSQHWFQ